MRRVYEPGEAAVRVSGWVTGWTADAAPQASAALRCKVPEDGVSCSPDGSAETCQSTVVAAAIAGTAPSCTAVGFPALTDTAPLGKE